MSRPLVLVTAGVVLVIVGVVAYSVGLTNIVFAPDTETVVAIKRSGDRCGASVRDDPHSGYRFKLVKWTIQDPDKCLDDGEVEVRFVVNGTPFNVDRGRNRQQINLRVNAGARIKRNSPDTYVPYEYTIWYVRGTAEYQMTDPRLEIEY